MAWWLGFGALPAMARVQSLIRELRSHKPRSMAKLIKKFKSHRGDRGYEESLVCMLFLITNLPGPLPQCRWLILSNRENKNRWGCHHPKWFQYLSGHPLQTPGSGFLQGITHNLTHMPTYITLALPSLLFWHVQLQNLILRLDHDFLFFPLFRLPTETILLTSSRLSEPWATPLFPAYPPSPDFTSFPCPGGLMWPLELHSHQHLSSLASVCQPGPQLCLSLIICLHPPPFQEDDHSWSKGHSGRNRCQPTVRRAQSSSGLRAFLWFSPVLHQLSLLVILQLFPSSYASEYLCFLIDKLAVIISILQVVVKNDGYARKWPGTLQIIHIHSSFIASFLAPNTICISLTLYKPPYLTGKIEDMRYGEDGELYRPNLQTWLTPTCTNLHLVFEEGPLLFAQAGPSRESDTRSVHPFSHLYRPPFPPHCRRSYTCSDLPHLKRISFSLGSKSHLSFLSQSSFFREWSGLIVSTFSPPTDFSPHTPAQCKFLSALRSPAWSSTVDYRALITAGAKGPLRENSHAHKKHPFLFTSIYTGTSSPDPNPSPEFKSALYHFLAMWSGLSYLTSLVKWD